MKKIFWFLLILMCSSQVFSQFIISGVFRPRFEYRDGYSTLRDSSTDFAAFVSQRTRISMDYKDEKLNTKLTLYDFRVWGDQIWKSDQPSTGIFEAWAEIFLTSNLSIRAGRQALHYDNGRLLSRVNWNQIGAAHDAVLFRYKKDKFNIDMGMAFNQSSQNLFSTTYKNINNYKEMGFLWINRNFDNFDISALSIVDGYQVSYSVPVDYARITAGLITKYKLNNFDFQLRLFGQGGHSKTGEELMAYYNKTDITYNINEKYKITAGLEIISGDSDPLDNNDNAFDLVLGSRHAFNGNMDYYSDPSTTANKGLINPYMLLTFQLNENNQFCLNYHYFMLNQEYEYLNNNLDRFLGHEIDLLYTKKISENVDVQSGYSIMFASETAEIIKNGNKDLLNNWFFIMLSVKPEFFNFSRNK
ncbi:MAG: alginate export family protein [Marinilabiliales bacterium]